MRVTAAIALFNEDATEILLGKRTDNGKWALIGGGVEEGESSEVAIRREVGEEIGLLLGRIERVSFFESEGLLVLVYVATVESYDRVENLEPHKNSELKWWHVWDLPDAAPWCGIEIIRKAQGVLLNV